MRGAFLSMTGFLVTFVALAFALADGRAPSPDPAWAGLASEACDSGHACRKLQELAKIDPRYASQYTCESPGDASQAVDLERGQQRFSKRSGRVAAMVEEALQDQVALLEDREAELKRWDTRAQAHFARWFGTTDPRARVRIFRRIEALLKINDAYEVRNFRRAIPSRPGVFAFVRANDPSRVFLDKAFVHAPPVGANSRAGTITHEMSHFLIAGGTKDHAYGEQKCAALARSSPVLALNNADNFEFYVEDAK